MGCRSDCSYECDSDDDDELSISGSGDDEGGLSRELKAIDGAGLGFPMSHG